MGGMKILQIQDRGNDNQFTGARTSAEDGFCEQTGGTPGLP
jgi:hypothetical protein